MIGRRSKLTDTVIEKVCESRSIGATWKIASNYAGVSESVLMSWIKEGRELQEKIESSDDEIEFTDHQKMILEFLRRVTKADTDDDIALLNVIDRDASRDPALAEKRLRWKHKGDFETSQKIDANVTATVASVTPEQLAAARAAALAFEESGEDESE